MSLIKNYITEDDGTTTVVISGVELGNKETLLLDNGFEVEVDVQVVDPLKITDKQRRKIFALVAYKTSDLLKQDKSFLYWSTVNRNCVICGKRGELAHHKAIGRGANRKKMDHYGYEVLCLCREHHQSQHDMGVETFDKLHHLENSWLSVDSRLNDMLKGEKIK